MRINGRIVYQLLKYSVYALLTINVYIFFNEELAAVSREYPGGLAAGDFFMAYAATIDTAAWLILLLTFEYDTFARGNRRLTLTATLTPQILRIVCYIFILSAFSGYIGDAIFVRQVSELAGVRDLCTLAGRGWSFAITFGEYAEITAANCAGLTSLDTLMRFDGLNVVVDGPGMKRIRFLSSVDVVNACVWLLVVLLLEVDVRLQQHDRLEGMALLLSNAAKTVLYTTLTLAVVAWSVFGDFEDWWDALLWLIAFVFIELNILAWGEASEQRIEAR